MHASYKEQIGGIIASQAFDWGDSSFYLLGSLKEEAESFHHSMLSDVDLLVVPTCDSLSDYVSHFEQAINLASELNKNDQLFDVFVMSNKIAQFHYSCLSIYSGSAFPYKRDRIVGSGIHENSFSSTFNIKVIKDFYIARAIDFCNKSMEQLPNADTSQARKVSKALLRGLKLIICAQEDENTLLTMESKLSKNYTFEEVADLLETKLEVEVKEVLESALAGKNVDDWAEWMIAQEKLVYFLSTMKKMLSLEDSRLRMADTITKILRDMLIIEVKNIVCEEDESIRKEKIEVFLNLALSLVSRLAIGGVGRLKDFTRDDTPALVADSFDIIEKNLKGYAIDIYTFVASVILLEYAFQEGGLYYERTYTKSK